MGKDIYVRVLQSLFIWNTVLSGPWLMIATLLDWAGQVCYWFWITVFSVKPFKKGMRNSLSCLWENENKWVSKMWSHKAKYAIHYQLLFRWNLIPPSNIKKSFLFLLAGYLSSPESFWFVLIQFHATSSHSSKCQCISEINYCILICICACIYKSLYLFI